MAKNLEKSLMIYQESVMEASTAKMLEEKWGVSAAAPVAVAAVAAAPVAAAENRI